MKKSVEEKTRKKRNLRISLCLGLIVLLIFVGCGAVKVFQNYYYNGVVNGGPPDQSCIAPEPSAGGDAEFEPGPEPGLEPEAEPEPEPEPEPTPPAGGPPPPDETRQVADGNYLQVVVDRQNSLGHYAPADLKQIPGKFITPGQRQWNYYLRSEALEHLAEMIEAARTAGLDLFLNSAYRSYDTQRQLFQDYASRHGEENADTFSARPGHSEHQLGTTVDFVGTTTDSYYSIETVTNADLDEVLTTAGKWLAENAYRYGFALSYPPGSKPVTGYIYEPWHFRYIGVEAAQAWYESGEILCLFLMNHYPQEFVP